MGLLLAVGGPGRGGHAVRTTLWWAPRRRPGLGTCSRTSSGVSSYRGLERRHPQQRQPQLLRTRCLGPLVEHPARAPTRPLGSSPAPAVWPGGRVPWVTDPSSTCAHSGRPRSQLGPGRSRLFPVLSSTALGPSGMNKRDLGSVIGGSYPTPPRTVRPDALSAPCPKPPSLGAGGSGGLCTPHVPSEGSLPAPHCTPQAPCRAVVAGTAPPDRVPQHCGHRGPETPCGVLGTAGS